MDINPPEDPAHPQLKYHDSKAEMRESGSLSNEVVMEAPTKGGKNPELRMDFGVDGWKWGQQMRAQVCCLFPGIVVQYHRILHHGFD